MFDTEILNKDAVLLKCDEIKSKYLDIFDALISRDTIFATFKIEGMQDFTMQEKKYADLYLIFKDLENKYDYFAGIVELESVPQTIEPGTDAGFSFPYRRDLFEDGSLKDKIASFDAQLVECA